MIPHAMMPMHQLAKNATLGKMEAISNWNFGHFIGLILAQ
jgi:hypothetical protein